MRTLHLFAGAGGGLLADLILGHTPIGAVEIDPYCCAVLRERAAEGWFPGLRVHEQDIRLFDPSEYTGRVDCVSGGFPCQDISAAGRGAGITGERSGLWSEFARVIRLVRPRYAFIENSPMLTSRGLDRVLADLAEMGFDAQWAVVSAADTGAPHRRERIWILAYLPDAKRDSIRNQKQRQTRRWFDIQNRRSAQLEHDGEAWAMADADIRRQQKQRQQEHPQQQSASRDQPDGCGSARRRNRTFPDANRINARHEHDGSSTPIRTAKESNGECRNAEQARDWWQFEPNMGGLADGLAADVVHGWWQTEPDVGRVASGVKDRVKQLKALGNGQVPKQAALAWRILMEQAA